MLDGDDIPRRWKYFIIEMDRLGNYFLNRIKYIKQLVVVRHFFIDIVLYGIIKILNACDLLCFKGPVYNDYILTR